MEEIAALAAANKRILLLDDLRDWRGLSVTARRGIDAARHPRVERSRLPGLLLAGSSLHFDEPDYTWAMGITNCIWRASHR